MEPHSQQTSFLASETILKMDVFELRAALDQERRRNVCYAEENDRLVELLRQFKRDVFGPRKERWIPSEQIKLFNEAEQSAAEAEPCASDKTQVEVKAHTKTRGKRKPLPENLPREVVIVDIPESEKKDEAGNLLVRLVGHETSEQLEYSPSSIKVLEIRRLKYEAIDCSGESIVRTAAPRPHILPKSMATASLVAGIVTHKYGDGLPLYRLEEIFTRAGIDLPRQTMGRWIVTVAAKCQPLWNVFEE